MINNNNNNSIGKVTDHLIKKSENEDPPKDTDDCLICGENFPLIMPYSSIQFRCYTSQEIWINRQNFLRSGYKSSIYDDDEEFWSEIENIEDLIHTYICHGKLCKHCFLELDQWIQEKQKQYNWK